MRYALSHRHYAAEWPLDETYNPDDITQLGIRSASLPAGSQEREQVLLQILRAFHGYLLKYVHMIVRGHIPNYRHGFNQDSANFLGRFLGAGDEAMRDKLQATCRTLHLAFDGQSFDEVYNILTSLLIKVIDFYDPEYTNKVRLVAEAIEKKTVLGQVIQGPELGLPFPPKRFLRWMARHGILEPILDPREKRPRFIGFRIGEWPPKEGLLTSKPIGLAYHVQKWFGNFLQAYITSAMKEVESAEDVLQLEHRGGRNGSEKAGYKISADMGLPCASNTGAANPRTGRHNAFEDPLRHGEPDVSELNLDWVRKTSDPLFATLSTYERHLLYLHFGEERTWKQMARICRKGIRTVQEDLPRVLTKVRRRAGVSEAEPCEVQG